MNVSTLQKRRSAKRPRRGDLHMWAEKRARQRRSLASGVNGSWWTGVDVRALRIKNSPY